MEHRDNDESAYPADYRPAERYKFRKLEFFAILACNLLVDIREERIEVRTKLNVHCQRCLIFNIIVHCGICSENLEYVGI